MDPSTEQASFVNTYLHGNASPPQAIMQSQKGKLMKKTKVLQTVFCGFCNIECNSKEVFDQHVLGKRHMKNVERLRSGSATKQNVSGIGVTIPNQTAAGQEVSNSKRKEPCASKPVVDLEIKKLKVVAGGADPKDVRICTICNVVCNSDLVFNFHLSGQKHASQLKKQTNGTAAA